MIYAIVIGYIAMGSVSEFMTGYAAPGTQRRSTVLTDWKAFLMWPLIFPTVVGNFGAAVRVGWEK